MPWSTDVFENNPEINCAFHVLCKSNVHARWNVCSKPHDISKCAQLWTHTNI